MGFEIGNAFGFVRCAEREGPHIECIAVALAEEVDRTGGRIKHRIAVLAGTVGQIRMLAGGEIHHPYVAGDGRRMVLSPFVLESLHVLIEHHIAVGTEGGHLSRRAEHLPGFSALHPYSVELAHARARKHC